MLSPYDRSVALQALAERLSAVHGRWRVDGDVVRSSRTPTVRVENTCDMTGVAERIAHLDVEFALNPDYPDSIVFDCASGSLIPRERAVVQAVDFWMKTTAPALLTPIRGRHRLAQRRTPGRSPLVA